MAAEMPADNVVTSAQVPGGDQNGFAENFAGGDVTQQDREREMELDREREIERREVLAPALCRHSPP